MVQRGQAGEASTSVQESTELKRDDEDEKVTFSLNAPTISGIAILFSLLLLVV